MEDRIPVLADFVFDPHPVVPFISSLSVYAAFVAETSYLASILGDIAKNHGTRSFL